MTWSKLLLILWAFFAASCTGPVEPNQQAFACPDRERGFPPEMEAHRSSFEASELTYIAITAEAAKTSPWDSKFLGVPYWPRDAEYPKDADGRDLQLLAQINFAQTPKLDDYPDQGILQFFVSPFDSNEHAWGMRMYRGTPFVAEDYLRSMKSQDYFRVVYHEAPVADAALLDADERLFPGDLLPVTTEARLSFTLESGFVPVSDVRFKTYFGLDSMAFFDQFGAKACEVGDAYFQYAHEHSLAKIGGYSFPVQEDPRVLATESDWTVLLEIQSSAKPDEIEILWGDVGMGVFYIRRSDLVRRDFSNIIYYWDNH